MVIVHERKPTEIILNGNLRGISVTLNIACSCKCTTAKLGSSQLCCCIVASEMVYSITYEWKEIFT